MKFYHKSTKNNSPPYAHKYLRDSVEIIVPLSQNRGVAIIQSGFYTNGIEPQLTKYMEKNIHNVASPDDALAQFVGEQYIEWLVEYFEHEVATWEALDLIGQAAPKPDKIKKFLGQRYMLDQIFFGGRDSDPGFLGFAVANLSESPEPLAEHVLDIINSRRQADNSTAASHRKEAWARSLRSVGLSDDDIKRIEPKEAARNYASELSDLYSNAEWQTVLSAFFAHEKLVQAEYEVISHMLKQSLGESVDTEAMSGKVKQDNKYLIDARHLLERSAVDDESKSLIFQGVDRQLTARKDYYTATVKYLYE